MLENLNPWEAFCTTFSVGSPITGVVQSKHPFGVFVDVGYPGVRALLELGEMPDERGYPDMVPNVGDDVHAVIIHMEGPKKQVVLSIRPALLNGRSSEPIPR